MIDKTIEMGIREIWSQCRYAEIAYSNVLNKSERDVAVTFSSIHSFLSHCGLVSKLLWSTTLSENIQNKKLTEILLIEENSAIKERTFRDILEHYDTYLKKWIKEKGEDIAIWDNNIGPVEAFNFQNGIRVRHFDPTTSTYTLIDSDLNLQNMYIAILDIKQKADDWVKINIDRSIPNPIANSKVS